VLAGYEVDLLGSAALDALSTSTTTKSLPKLNIPATVSVHSSLGPSGSDFEVRLQLNPRFSGTSSSAQASAAKSSLSRHAGFSSSSAGTTAAPAIEEMIIHIPLPASVRNVADLRVLRGTGDAGYAPGDRSIEWRITSREISSLMSQDRGGGIGATATLRGTVIGQDDESDALDAGGPVSFSTSTYDYDDDEHASVPEYTAPKMTRADADANKIKANKVLMPSCATVSFSVKGWLPSGIKVESLNVDQKKSKGLGSGVTPYKGVKYLCVSRQGVECRC
jgi:hypothetical protein